VHALLSTTDTCLGSPLKPVEGIISSAGRTAKATKAVKTLQRAVPFLGGTNQDRQSSYLQMNIIDREACSFLWFASIQGIERKQDLT
jgi:hypothetical protein